MLPKIGKITLDNPIAIVYSVCRLEGVMPSNLNGSAGLIMLGEIDLDESPPSKVEEFLGKIDETRAIGFSISYFSHEDAIEAARLAARRGALLELDLTNGADTDQITNLVGDLKKMGAVISIKLRPDKIDDIEIFRLLRNSGTDLIHLDLTRFNGAQEKMIKKISNIGCPAIMVMSDVSDFEDARSLFSMGADIISLKEKTDPEFLDWLTDAFRRYEKLIGWYNAPKHICAGGDLRGLTFCCPPVKNCPVLGALKKTGLTPEEFIRIKVELARGTPLQYGDGTCFGSLVWCCKITKPCVMRNAVLERLGLTARDYMELKRKLAMDILGS